MQLFGWFALSLALMAPVAAPPWPGHPEDRTSAQEAAPRLGVTQFSLPAPGVSPKPLHVTVYLPPGYSRKGPAYPVLYANDGQDMRAVALEATLAALYRDHLIEPVIVVAVDMPDDRMGAYGLTDRNHRVSIVAQTKYGPVGTHAQAYAAWFTNKLVPAIDARFHTRHTPHGRAVLGWSLGALQAFGMAWQYPELFGTVGAFSPSFWLAADRENGAAVDRSRYVMRMIDATHTRPPLRIWLSVGSAEESSDRDNDGVNDAVGDVNDAMHGFRAADGSTLHGLQQLGFATARDDDAAHSGNLGFFLLPDGQHNQGAWAQMLPRFLLWAYGKDRRTVDQATR